MSVPKEAIATTKKGEKEVRVLRAAGRFVMYEYETLDGKKVGKYSILLEDEGGNLEHLMIVPLKNRELVVSHKRERGITRGILNKKTGKVVRFP